MVGESEILEFSRIGNRLDFVRSMRDMIKEGLRSKVWKLLELSVLFLV